MKTLKQIHESLFALANTGVAETCQGQILQIAQDLQERMNSDAAADHRKLRESIAYEAKIELYSDLVSTLCDKLANR